MHAADCRCRLRRFPRLPSGVPDGFGSSHPGRSVPLAALIFGIIINVAGSSLALAERDETTASRCRSEVSYCLTKCERAFHREEAVHACRQECQSDEASCRTDAQHK